MCRHVGCWILYSPTALPENKLIMQRLSVAAQLPCGKYVCDCRSQHSERVEPRSLNHVTSPYRKKISPIFSCKIWLHNFQILWKGNIVLDNNLPMNSISILLITRGVYRTDFTEMREKIITFKLFFVTWYCFVIFLLLYDVCFIIAALKFSSCIHFNKTGEKINIFYILIFDWMN